MLHLILRPRTVKLITRLLRPLVDEGVILVSEERTINANLKHLSQTGTLMPVITPRLIDKREVAKMLGVGYSNFQKLEKANAFSFKRRMVGGAIRYRNLDIIEYIMTDDTQKEEVQHE